MSAASQSLWGNLMKWDVILFDLDGTITDPKDGITKSVAYALNEFGFRVEDPNALVHFIGPPLCESFTKYYGLDKEQAMFALEKYRERYSSIGWKENAPYHGIAFFLQSLKESGRKLLIATSKAQVYAVKILQHFGLDTYFDYICGTPLDDPNQTKADVIRFALQQANITNNARVVMVGDRLHDIVGGHEAGIEAIGVLYGYGNKQELEEYHADYIVESITELSKLLLT